MCVNYGCNYFYTKTTFQRSLTNKELGKKLTKNYIVGLFW